MTENDDLREIIIEAHRLEDEWFEFMTCHLCGDVFHIDDIDKDYGACKQCVEDTEDAG